MKRNALLLAASILLVAALAGCGGNKTDSAKDSSSAAAKVAASKKASQAKASSAAKASSESAAKASSESAAKASSASAASAAAASSKAQAASASSAAAASSAAKASAAKAAAEADGPADAQGKTIVPLTANDRGNILRTMYEAQEGLGTGWDSAQMDFITPEVVKGYGFTLGVQPSGGYGLGCGGGAKGINLYNIFRFSDGTVEIDGYYGSLELATPYKKLGVVVFHDVYKDGEYGG